MPTLAEEASLAPPATAITVNFKPGAWACTGEEFKLQVSDHQGYYASPVVRKIVGGPPEFCRATNTSHTYALQAPAAVGPDADGPCPTATAWPSSRASPWKATNTTGCCTH